MIPNNHNHLYNKYHRISHKYSRFLTYFLNPKPYGSLCLHSTAKIQDSHTQMVNGSLYLNVLGIPATRASTTSATFQP